MTAAPQMPNVGDFALVYTDGRNDLNVIRCTVTRITPTGQVVAASNDNLTRTYRFKYGRDRWEYIGHYFGPNLLFGPAAAEKLQELAPRLAIQSAWRKIRAAMNNKPEHPLTLSEVRKYADDIRAACDELAALLK